MAASTISTPNTGKKRKADADAMAGVAHLGDMAHERELNYVMERLRQDKETTFTLGSLMRDDTLKIALAGGFAKGPKVVKRKRLVKYQKRWKNLKFNLLELILRELEPGVFTNAVFQDPEVSEPALLDWMCFGLNTTPDSKIPLAEYPQVVYVDELLKVAVARYEKFGKRLSEFGDTTKRLGYFQLLQVDGTPKVKYVLGGQLFGFPFQENKYNQTTIDKRFVQGALAVVQKPRRMVSLMDELKDAHPDVNLAPDDDEDEEWALEGITSYDPDAEGDNEEDAEMVASQGGDGCEGGGGGGAVSAGRVAKAGGAPPAKTGGAPPAKTTGGAPPAKAKAGAAPAKGQAKAPPPPKAKGGAKDLGGTGAPEPPKGLPK